MPTAKLEQGQTVTLPADGQEHVQAAQVRFTAVPVVDKQYTVDANGNLVEVTT